MTIFILALLKANVTVEKREKKKLWFVYII